MDIKQNIIFSSNLKSNKDATQEENDSLEKKDTSYLLEKLHIQREELRKIDELKKARIEINTQREGFAKLGRDAHITNLATKKELDDQTVSDLVKKSNRRIITISSTFPWDIFPNTIVVEESRITFKFSQLFSSQSHSVEIKDISNVFIESSLFFATLQIVSRTYVKNDIKIGKLNKKRALAVQKIIEGLRTFSEHNINTSAYEIEELVSKIGEFHSKYI